MDPIVKPMRVEPDFDARYPKDTVRLSILWKAEAVFENQHYARTAKARIPDG
jgi:hypothetical protein